MSPTVVVTGIGATTPLGGDVASTWEGMLAGRSGVRLLTGEKFDVLPVRIAATLAVEPTDVLSRVEARRLDRNEQAGLIAAREAWADSGLAAIDDEIDRSRMVVSVGTGIGGLHTLLSSYDTLNNEGPRKVSPYTIPMIMPNGAAGWIGVEFKARGGVHAPVSACASGNEAIARGFELIRSGAADVAIVGGAEAVVHPLPLASFAAMKALSGRNDDPTTASRPFDADRDGFVLGEGAGILVLESAEFAAARGARVYATVLGAGLSGDGHHIAQPEPSGLGATMAMQRALTSAGIDPSDVVHVNAHSTSTPVGDIAEAKAIHNAFGHERARRMVVTAPKSTMGHLLGAAGAVESIQTVLSLHYGKIPPTINLDKLDPDIDLDVATSIRDLPAPPTPGATPAAVNNSFGFGGANAAIVFGKAEA